MRILSALLLFALCFLSCGRDEDEFYRTYRIEDFYAIPLIEPYYLYATTPAHDAHWFFFFRNNLKPGELYGDKPYDQLPVIFINVDNGIIYGETEYSNTFFAVVPAEKIELIFHEKQKWKEYLANRNIGTDTTYNHLHPDMPARDTMYDPYQVYRRFKDEHWSLPWHSL